MHTKTTQCATKTHIDRKWYLIDATDLVVGRLASQIATILRGKNKACYTPNIDCGDFVIVINADKVKFTGKKLSDKVYYHHTAYIGGIKGITAQKVMETHPERVLQKAVERMLSRNKMGRAMMKKLFVYAGAEHKHSAQNPITLDVGAMNAKNKKDIS